MQIVVCILANAVKYTPSGGKVSVSIDEKYEDILLQIKDSGIGIPEDEISRVFDEFYRASNAKKTERDGTGLGLSIAKQVIEKHNGRIWAESELGKGTVLKVLLKQINRINQR